MLSDDHESIRAAVLNELPGAESQGCTVHFERNILSHAMSEVAEDLSAISKSTE